ncbi:CRP-like cAMP-binding protein [Chryseobacterium sp. H1D6B]|uniref:Crp/Fnr family transcriptional regulator n=1 Tax=Chryseobacterium sp. H1D6B TaxID=2940588 RepID=UPI0015CACB15|nr:Crp/Fnr family transcriptional regulator [Chryseobacterium sp. H1D6B]MDH6253002.1 CRP-like cAMP-binding protein [Chryseobacterium sp. H1D6B]
MKKLSYFTELNDDELAALEKICTKTWLKKREIFVRPGDVNRNFMLIKKGMVRGYFYDEEGVEHTLFIPDDKESIAFGIPGSFNQGKPTKYYFEAIEETELLVFNVNEFENIAVQYQRIMNLYLGWLKNAFQILVSRLEILTTQKPCNRLNKLLEQRPNTVLQAKRKHLASFLGITPNSLSRIAARIKKTKKLS